MTTLDDTQGWKARVTESPADFTRDTRRLMVGNDGWQGGEPALNLLVGFDDEGHAVMRTVPAAARIDFPGFELPNSALAAIRNAIEPGPSVAELRRLEQALDVERGRVDRVLDRRADEPPPVASHGHADAIVLAQRTANAGGEHVVVQIRSGHAGLVDGAEYALYRIPKADR